MNIFVAASRGGGIRKRVQDFTLYTDVIPGAKLSALTTKAISKIPSPRRTIGTTHVYIMGGLPDITQKLKAPHKHIKYTECIYTEPTTDTITRITKEIDESAEKIIKAGARPCFCTISSSNIEKYNQTLLRQRKTHSLHYKDEYNTMQSNLETALVSINKHICKVNHENNMSTPYCHTAIRKRKGKHPRYYYKHAYDLLWDGVHGTDTTRDKWAEAIQGAIRSNRGKRKTPDTEDEQKSPKRSWRREKMAQS